MTTTTTNPLSPKIVMDPIEPSHFYSELVDTLEHEIIAQHTAKY